jgi:hypothetical protein
VTLREQVTAAQHAKIVARILEALPRAGIPDHLHDGLVRYFADGILPGSFLQAVLCNDLTQTVKRGDRSSLAALPPLVEFLLWVAPMTAWGTRNNVLAWTTTPDRMEV